MFTVAIVNSKGGAGKTTLATNIASYYASQSFTVAMKDYDSQGSSTYWHKRRGDLQPGIQCIPIFNQVVGRTSSFAHHPKRGTEVLIIDSPSGIEVNSFKEVLAISDVIIIPVLPSAIDIHAVSRFISELLLKAKIDRKVKPIAVVANRARKNTLVYRKLEKFLDALGIPFIATLRDTQNYIKASEDGVGVIEMNGDNLFKDHKSMKAIFSWLESVRLSQQRNIDGEEV